MNRSDHHQHAGGNSSGSGITRGKVVFAIFMAVALFFLLTEHRAHFFGALPFLLILACPLLHLFHHGGHGSHRHGTDTLAERPSRTTKGLK